MFKLERKKNSNLIKKFQDIRFASRLTRNSMCVEVEKPKMVNFNTCLISSILTIMERVRISNQCKFREMPFHSVDYPRSSLLLVDLMVSAQQLLRNIMQLLINGQVSLQIMLVSNILEVFYLSLGKHFVFVVPKEAL